jgi:hypothetical protein
MKHGSVTNKATSMACIRKTKALFDIDARNKNLKKLLLEIVFLYDILDIRVCKKKCYGGFSG